MTIFKSMTPDPSSQRRDPLDYLPEWALQGEDCERCGSTYYAGDWPFCKGDPRDHWRT